ncbi:ATP-binding protein [Pseudaquabacterium terrae]|uniref:ATP-binding protein n=1 Tax=Pseudaquabacterium terrae TaxID=2732868 RepID=UPI0031B5AEB4
MLATAAPGSWAVPAATGHFVRFYDHDALLLDEVATFIGDALRAGGTGIVIASAEHLAALEQRLGPSGAQPAGGTLVLRDAAQCLAQFMVDDWPDEQRFRSLIGEVIAAAGAGGRVVHAFGEMVALLCERGRYDAAVRLEQLWNALMGEHRFSLFCAYPWRLFPTAEHAAAFERVCGEHQHACSHSHRSIGGDAQALQRRLASLEQQALALQAEIARRETAEQALRRREVEREAMLTELSDSSRAKDEFLAMLGHELRNPLAPIVSALHLMRRRGGVDSTREQGIILRQVEHLVRLVDDLLDVARVTRGQIALRHECVELQAVLGQAVELARPLIEQRGHRLHTDIAPGLRCEGDPVRLAQVIANLLTNAARYTEPGGEIHLLAQPVDDERLCIRVIDNGIGVALPVLPRIFDLFYQGRRDLARAGGGLGIGLALVRKIVELHGGSVEARSEGPGRGSEFIVRLPLRAAAPRLATPAANDGAPPVLATPQRRRVMVVDDNVDGAQTLGCLLAAGGHEVEVFNEPLGALAALQRFGPEVAVLDIGLPVMDGYELAGRIRAAIGPDACRLIALSGYGQDTDRQRSHDAGFEQHLVKPVSAEQILGLVAAGQRPAAAA